MITSPGYPNAYRQEARCRWTIDAPTETDKVEVTVTSLNLQTTPSCAPEYLEMRDYPLVNEYVYIHVYNIINYNKMMIYIISMQIHVVISFFL